MTTDNFDQINRLISFPEGEFYYVQILQRGKDGHKKNGNNRNRLVYSYFINSQEYYDRKRNEIIEICETFNARAMIHLSRRNYQRIAMDTLVMVAEQISTGNITHLYRVYNSACGRNKGVNKLWLVDLDGYQTHGEVITKLSLFINGLDPLGHKIKDYIPSKSGYHIITAPFNLKEFHKEYPTVEVHKNNPTNLYIP